MSKSERMEKFLNRRMMGADGNWHLFCRMCGEYKPETEFYNSKDTPWGKTHKCKIHYKVEKEEVDEEMSYFRLSPITDSDFEGVERLLTMFGYKIGPDELPIWKQFEIKHNIKTKKL